MINPVVSIIIPTTRPKKVLNLLSSLNKQTYPSDNFEVILVGNKLPKICISSYRIRKVVTQTKVKSGRARNIGAIRAKGKYLLFIDDDCQAIKNWIKENIKLLDHKGIGAVSGKIVGLSRDYFSRSYDFTDFDLCQTNKIQERVLSSSSLGTKIENFQQVGGFNENMIVKEDDDFCMRLQRIGLRTVYFPEIVVYHDHGRNTLLEILRHQYREGRIDGLLLFRNYPEESYSYRFFLLFKFWLSYLIFSPGFALVNVIITFKINFLEHPEVTKYLPIIYLAKLSYHIGVVANLYKKGYVET